MISNRIRNLYREARKAGSCRVGFAAVEALDTAYTLAKWEVLAELGYVRLIAEPDDDADLSWIDQDRYSDSDRERFRDDVETNGVWGSIGEFRLDPDSEDWQTADSVWGHTGYRNVLDWRENPYVLDIMDETIRQFRDAWKDHVRHVCPTCHGSGRID